MFILLRIGNWAFSGLESLSVIKVSVRKEQKTVVRCRISLSLLLLSAWSCRADGIHRDDGLKLSGETPKNTLEARLQRDTKDLKGFKSKSSRSTCLSVFVCGFAASAVVKCLFVVAFCGCSPSELRQ